MAQKQEKKQWKDMSDDEDDVSKSPQINQEQMQVALEYKLQPTGEINGGGNKHYHHKNAPKKPLPTVQEMIEQINTDKYPNVYLHCFAVNGSAQNFEEAFKGKVRYAQLTEADNKDRDNSIDLKFDDKQEAIKFIELSQTTSLNEKTFRVKFGKPPRPDGFKKGEYKDRPKYSQNERRDFRGGDRVNRNDNREHNHKTYNRDNREHNQNRENREHHYNRDNKEHHHNRDNREHKPYFKKDYHADKKQEEKAVQKPEQQVEKTTEAQQVPVEPPKKFGFTNSKKNQHLNEKENAQGEQIHCVDTNAKILEKQKRDEQERLARLEEEKKQQEQEKVEQKERHPSKDDKHGKGKREDGSKGKPKKTEKVVYEKKETQKPSQPEAQVAKTQEKTASHEENNQQKKKLKLPEQKQEDEWIQVGTNTEAKKKGEDKGRNGNKDSKRNNNNNNNKKSDVKYERKENQK